MPIIENSDVTFFNLKCLNLCIAFAIFVKNRSKMGF